MTAYKATLITASLAAALLTGQLNAAPASKAESKITATLKLKPDLVIRVAHLQLAKTCKRFQPVLRATVRVQNIGNAASQAKLNVGMVNAMDTHGNGWGNGKGLPSILPGKFASVTFPVYYLISNPGHMPGSHVFHFRVNKAKWITESNYNNNSAKVKIKIPAGFCRKQPVLTHRPVLKQR